MDIEQLQALIAEHKVKNIDLKYVDLVGRWYHINFPARRLAYVMEKGIPFDGSSIPGMRNVESGDLILMPDLTTAKLDGFSENPTIQCICSILDAETMQGYEKDPRSVAARACDYLQETGIADEILFIPEFEFNLLNEAVYYNSKHKAGYRFSTKENKEALPFNYEDPEAAALTHRKGYHLDRPHDQHGHARQEIADYIDENICPIRYHHHEVGISSQQEIETELCPFPKIADDIMCIKDVIRQVAHKHGLAATLMPKPMYGEAGNGMHFHMLLKKAGRNILYQRGGYADLSDDALHFIGGILYHGRSLVALTNPSTNSYKRLLPGFEAPVRRIFGLANRSAAIRIPLYANSEDSKRFEFRTGDATCNPYLATSALIMAGIDGIQNKIHPGDHGFGPYDEDIFKWSDEKREQLPAIPANLGEAIRELARDHAYLLQGGVFGKNLIEAFINEKLQEVRDVNERPTPYEMNLYFSL
ncbi:MAG TPA: type I glutamate--ammonia ligase [Desulfuromonadales bacterium]|nr:type I glutamate--ammonia ligase [Desulfuromonadales bacterium]